MHAVNSDLTTSAEGSKLLLGLDKELYLGTILQNAANKTFRPADGQKPSVALDRVDPTPGVPGLNHVVRMPEFPMGSPFILDGLMASTPGLPVGSELNENGHAYWVDRQAGFTAADQTSLIQFLLSLDDAPEVLSETQPES